MTGCIKRRRIPDECIEKRLEGFVSHILNSELNLLILGYVLNNQKYLTKHDIRKKLFELTEYEPVKKFNIRAIEHIILKHIFLTASVEIREVELKGKIVRGFKLKNDYVNFQMFAAYSLSLLYNNLNESSYNILRYTRKDPKKNLTPYKRFKILKAIANGKTKLEEISNDIGLPLKRMPRELERLANLELISYSPGIGESEPTLLEKGRKIYELISDLEKTFKNPKETLGKIKRVTFDFYRNKKEVLNELIRRYYTRKKSSPDNKEKKKLVFENLPDISETGIPIKELIARCDFSDTVIRRCLAELEDFVVVRTIHTPSHEKLYWKNCSSYPV